MTTLRKPLLRVAVIGTGFGARVQLPALMSMGDVQVVALCGRDEEKTKAIAAQFSVQAVYTDYEQMLVDVQPDIVSITTPPATHNPMTVAALQVGAHVICEKPMALDTAEAEEMLQVAEQLQRVHAIDFEFRYLPARYYQKVLVDQGYIGEPLLLEAAWIAPMRWDPRAWNWWSDAGQGGGMLGAVGSHLIDGFRWLSGREVRAVTAMLYITPQYSTRALPEGRSRAVTADDSGVLALEFDDGLRGMITLSAVAAADANRIAIHGTEGALVVTNHLELWGRRRGQDLHKIDVPGEYDPPIWIPNENLLLGPFVKLTGLVVDQVRGHAIVQAPSFADGIAVQRVMDAARLSAREGRRIAL